jgi:tryptophan-rich sensory protein
MSWQPWLWAAGICAGAAALEGLCAGRDPMGELKKLRQPKGSPPAWLWVLIGLYWYGACLTVLVRLLPGWPTTWLPVLLLVALMVLNAAANIPLFRMRRLDLAFAFFILYWPVLAAFLWVVCPLDAVTCTLFALYAVYQLYAAVWGWGLWKLNPPAAPGQI